MKAPIDRHQRTMRDEYYINSTSFEVYMIGGTVFLGLYTLAFIASVMFHMEPLIWPSMFIAIGAAYGTLNWLSRRERAAKIREVDEGARPPRLF